MALLEKQLRVKQSQLPNAGKGLYTTKVIPKGTRIVEYKGRRSKWKDVKDEDGRNGYIFYINRNHVIDALPTKNALARYANDARGLVRIVGIINNADYIVDGIKAYIESKREIPAGAEIFVDYGKEYWQVIRENQQLWKKEAKEATKKKNAKKTNARKTNAKKKKAKTKNTRAKKAGKTNARAKNTRAKKASRK